MASIYFGLLALGAALAAPLAAIGAGIGEGILTFALVETLFIFGFVIFLILLGKLPSADQITTMLGK